MLWNFGSLFCLLQKSHPWMAGMCTYAVRKSVGVLCEGTSMYARFAQHAAPQIASMTSHVDRYARDAQRPLNSCIPPRKRKIFAARPPWSGWVMSAITVCILSVSLSIASWSLVVTSPAAAPRTRASRALRDLSTLGARVCEATNCLKSLSRRCTCARSAADSADPSPTELPSGTGSTRIDDGGESGVLPSSSWNECNGRLQVMNGPCSQGGFIKRRQ